jgi:signal transduction histidine kinase
MEEVDLQGRAKDPAVVGPCRERGVRQMNLSSQAALCAHENGFVHNEALAKELAGRFYLSRGLEKNGYVHLRDARACYALWGADGKVRQLDRLYPHLATTGGPRSTATIGSPVQQLDVASVVKASQAVSSEIGNRAGDVIRRVRALATKTNSQKAPLDVNHAVNEAIALVQRELLSHQVSLRIELSRALPVVLADRVQIQQVIINLMINGIEAMQTVADRPRVLVIESHQVEAHRVQVTVKDCGLGISAENADRLFAFFTTKSTGMGMGLSICRSIIAAHGGRLWAAPNLPQGATFHFTLPSHQESAL